MKKTTIFLITLLVSVFSFSQTTILFPGSGSMTVGHDGGTFIKIVTATSNLPTTLFEVGNADNIVIEGNVVLATNLLNSNDLTVLQLDMNWVEPVANFAAMDLVYNQPSDLNVVFMDIYENELDIAFDSLLVVNSTVHGGYLTGIHPTIVGASLYDTGSTVKALITSSITSGNVTFVTVNMVTDSIISELGGELPVANFYGTPPAITVGESVNFTDLSTGNPHTWFWEFTGGNPSTSTVQNPLGIAYNITGNHTVKLTVWNEDGSDSDVKYGYIAVSDSSGTLVSDFSWSPINPQVGETVQFVNHSLGNPTSKIWGFEGGDPFSATGDTVYVVYDVAELYSVTLFISDNQGNMADSTKTITISEILPVPIPGFTADKFIINPGESIHFQDTSLYATSHFWMFEGGTPGNSTEQNPVVTFNETGTYDILLITSNATGNASVLKQDYITVSPITMDTISFIVHIESSNRIDSTLAVINNTVYFQLWSSEEADSIFGDIAYRHAIISHPYPDYYEITITVQNDDPVGLVDFQIDFWKDGILYEVNETTDDSWVEIDLTPSNIQTLRFLTASSNNPEGRGKAGDGNIVAIEIASSGDITIDSAIMMGELPHSFSQSISVIDSVLMTTIQRQISKSDLEHVFSFEVYFSGPDINPGKVMLTSDGTWIEWIPSVWDFQVYPNPSQISGVAILNYDVPDNSKEIVIKVFDMTGRTLYVKEHNAPVAGFHRDIIPIDENFAKGLYIVQIIAKKYDGVPYVGHQKLLIQ